MKICCHSGNRQITFHFISVPLSISVVRFSHFSLTFIVFGRKSGGSTEILCRPIRVKPWIQMNDFWMSFRFGNFVSTSWIFKLMKLICGNLVNLENLRKFWWPWTQTIDFWCWLFYRSNLLMQVENFNFFKKFILRETISRAA